jgi:hypothetical protein
MFDHLIGYEVKIISKVMESKELDNGDIIQYPIEFNGTLVGIDENFVYIGACEEADIAIDIAEVFTIINNEIQDIGYLDEFDSGGETVH